MPVSYSLLMLVCNQENKLYSITKKEVNIDESESRNC